MDKEAAAAARERDLQNRLHEYKSRPSHQNSFHITGKPYVDLQNSLKGSVELDPYAVDAAGSAIINHEPEFMNKVEKSIYS